MGASAANALQKTIYAKLTGDATLMALIKGVFDRVPETQAFPYVTIGEDSLTDWSTIGKTGQAGTVYIHAWSQQPGRSECKSILNRIDTLLNRTTLTLTGFTMVSMVREFEQTMQDPDGITYHGVQRFRVLIST